MMIVENLAFPSSTLFQLDLTLQMQQMLAIETTLLDNELYKIGIKILTKNDCMRMWMYDAVFQSSVQYNGISTVRSYH